MLVMLVAAVVMVVVLEVRDGWSDGDCGARGMVVVVVVVVLQPLLLQQY